MLRACRWAEPMAGGPAHGIGAGRRLCPIECVVWRRQGHGRRRAPRRFGNGEERYDGGGPGGHHRRFRAYRATALEAGSYTVSAALGGFKTAIAKMVRVAPGQPVSIPLTLEIGQLEETVTVTSSSELINAERHGGGNPERRPADPAADADQERAERGHLPAGHQHHRHEPRLDDQRAAGNLRQHLDRRGQQQRQLPRGTDSFFARSRPGRTRWRPWPSPSLPAVLQVGGGSGAVTMAFQTRSGGNRFTGSAYDTTGTRASTRTTSSMSSITRGRTRSR